MCGRSGRDPIHNPQKRFIWVAALSLAIGGCAGTTDNGEVGAPQSGAAPGTVATPPPQDAAEDQESIDPRPATQAADPASPDGDPTSPEGDFVTREEWLADMWQGEGPHPPFPEFVREVGTEDFGETMSQCLTDAGFIAGTEGTAYWVDHTDEQEDALKEATWICLGQYPIKSSYYQPFTDDQLEALWLYQTTDLADCIKARGYSVPARPTEETFIAQWRAGGERWHPAAEVPGEHGYAVAQACPDFPAGFYDER